MIRDESVALGRIARTVFDPQGLSPIVNASQQPKHSLAIVLEFVCTLWSVLGHKDHQTCRELALVAPIEFKP
jgi:hypothetical protein